MIRSAIGDYDPSAPEASYMRAHQVEAMGALCSTIGALSIDEFAAGTGIAMVMPTGSGKTIMAGETLRMMKVGANKYLNDPDFALRALMLMPRRSISNQTMGNEDERGLRHFAPELSVAHCADIQPTAPADVNLSLYQGMAGLSRRGFLSKLDPSIVVCDEMHHVIDGKWARTITDLSPGRLLVGLSATPEYSAKKNVFDIFPKVAIRKSMRDGIEAGYLADLEGHLYKGTSRIQARRTMGDYNETDVFEALINSEDNYLAAKICAEEVSKGRKGVLFAVPGYDRAHSKLMAKILSEMTVDTPTGTRKIVAVHVDGDMSPREFEEINKAHREGDIDILCNVDLLLEGWDNPAAEFAFLMRPTMSRVMAEQRIGRILRFVQDKIATVHELMYEFTGQGAGEQITHLDILDRNSAVQGRSFRPAASPAKLSQAKKFKPGKFNANHFEIDQELLAKAALLDTAPIDEIKISCGQKLVPYDWPTLHQLCYKYNREAEEIVAILEEHGVLSRDEAYDGGTHTYYPPRSNDVLIEKLDIPDAPEDIATPNDLYELAQLSPLYRNLTRSALRRRINEDGYTLTIYRTADGHIVHAYPGESKSMFISEVIDWRKTRITKPKSSNPDPTSMRRRATGRAAAAPRPPRQKASKDPKPKQQPKGTRNEIPESPEELVEIVNWCDGILVPLETIFRPYEQKRVQKGQQELQAALRMRTFTPVPEGFKKVVKNFDGEVSEQVARLIGATKADLATVLFFAQRAKRVTDLAVENGKLK